MRPIYLNHSGSATSTRNMKLAHYIYYFCTSTSIHYTHIRIILYYKRSNISIDIQIRTHTMSVDSLIWLLLSFSREILAQICSIMCADTFPVFRFAQFKCIFPQYPRYLVWPFKQMKKLMSHFIACIR